MPSAVFKGRGLFKPTLNMQFKIKGIVTAIGDIKTTKMGTAVQQLHFEQESGRIIYPSALGTKIELLGDILPGDVAEIEFHISGSKGTYNNVIIDDLVRV
ncbi:MAG: hypothetical protein CMP77_11690 [Flavobacterium sp.]|nr:hypothetical protein [Flavobacterium sp.]|tara:strand:- start:65953 stop:66252 length:300 start_codon:yes stop_codon:yes gene_type:complete